jgi:hypothetical protein
LPATGFKFCPASRHAVSLFKHRHGKHEREETQ